MKYIRLGDLLVKGRIITQEQLEEALQLQVGSGQRLGEVLQQNGFITEKQLISTLMDQLGVEFIDLNTYSIPPEMASRYSDSLKQCSLCGNVHWTFPNA